MDPVIQDRSKKVVCKTFNMCFIIGEDRSKASSFFGATNETLTKDCIDWDNVVSTGLGNTNANMESLNSI